jgi:hypothetical protein
MRVYIAAPLKEHLLAEYVATLMALHGAHIVSSWHSDVTNSLQPGVDPPLDPAPNTLAGMTERMRIATKCLDEVGMLAPHVDKFVSIFTDRPDRGTYVELGAALARGVSVVLLNRTSEGASARHSVFDSHPLVRVVYDVREMLEAAFHPTPLLDAPDEAPTDPDAEVLPPTDDAS